MEDNASGPTVGKVAYRAREIEVFAAMENYKSKVLNRVFGSRAGCDLVVITVMANKFERGKYEEVKFQQSAVTYCKDGKVVKEQFYYSM